MRKIILLFVFVFSLFKVSAQVDTTERDCLTPDIDTTEYKNLPWFDNNDYLENFLDSIGYPAEMSMNRIIGQPQVRFWIPIKFGVCRNDDGNLSCLKRCRILRAAPYNRYKSKPIKRVLKHFEKEHMRALFCWSNRL